jgi:hypothetical protein
MAARFPVLIVAINLLLAATPSADTRTLTGEVVSISCYLHDKANVGRRGYVCALATVKWEGNPAGLLTADGKLYQIAGGLAAAGNAKLVPFLSRRVTITGSVFERSGMTMLEADEAAIADPPR